MSESNQTPGTDPEDEGRPVRPHRSGGGSPGAAAGMGIVAEPTAKPQKPSLGRIVLFTFPRPFNSNWSEHGGQGEQVPAIITAVWSDICVNLTVFVDGKQAAIPVTSVCLKTDQNEKNAINSNLVGSFWEWPPRV